MYLFIFNFLQVAMKEKMLTKLERDRAVGQVSCDIAFFLSHIAVSSYFDLF